MNALPHEIVEHILSFVTDIRYINNAMLVCTEWYDAMRYLNDKHVNEFAPFKGGFLRYLVYVDDSPRIRMFKRILNGQFKRLLSIPDVVIGICILNLHLRELIIAINYENKPLSITYDLDKSKVMFIDKMNSCGDIPASEYFKKYDLSYDMISSLDESEILPRLDMFIEYLFNV